MHNIFNNAELIIFDVMGVILEEGDLIGGGLHSLYKEKFSYEEVRELYEKIRKNPKGDRSLWEGLDEENLPFARESYLMSFDIDPEYFIFKERVLEKGFNIGVLSNMPKEWGEFLVPKLELDRDFKPMVFSGNVGKRKPDDDMYEYFISQTSIDPSKMVFIDDKLENLLPASRFGIKTVYFDRGFEKIDYKPDVWIYSFKELY